MSAEPGKQLAHVTRSLLDHGTLLFLPITLLRPAHQQSQPIQDTHDRKGPERRVKQKKETWITKNSPWQFCSSPPCTESTPSSKPISNPFIFSIHPNYTRSPSVPLTNMAITRKPLSPISSRNSLPSTLSNPISIFKKNGFSIMLEVQWVLCILFTPVSFPPSSYLFFPSSAFLVFSFFETPKEREKNNQKEINQPPHFLYTYILILP